MLQKRAGSINTRTLIVVPAYNEEASLPGVLDDLARHCPAHDVVVVDDGSSDATGMLAREAGVGCIRLPTNMGIGSALRTGFSYACSHGYDRAVQFDADGQHCADQVERLLVALDGGTNLAVGNRYAEGSYHMGLVRRLSVALLRVEGRVMCGESFQDITSGFKAVAQPLLERFADHYPGHYLLDTSFVMVAAHRAGYRVAEVPTKMRQRAGGEPSVGGVRLVVSYLRVVVALAFKSRGTRLRPKMGLALPNSCDHEDD